MVETDNRPTLAGAAEAGFHLLSPPRRHAPIGPASTVRARPHNPLLVAIQLTRLGDQLPPGDQLMFRIAHPIPRYPGLARDRRLGWQRLPDIKRLPDPSIAWLPQILWPDDALPKQVMDRIDAPVRAAAVVMAAARVGTDYPWPLIALELGLPTAATTRIGALWMRTRRDGTWPTALAALDRLIDRLQRHPPPIDYQIRRIIGDDTALLADAVDHACRDARTPPDDPLLLVRRFWELFTGGDIAYAPQALAIPVGAMIRTCGWPLGLVT